MDRTKSFLGAGIALVALAAANGCGSSSSSALPSFSQPTAPGVSYGTANVRFLNGSPDTSPTGGTISVAGASTPPLATDVKFGGITPFFPFAAGLPAVFVARSPAWASSLSCTTPYSLTSGGSYTVVVVGQPAQSGNQGLQCQIFFESYQSVNPGQGQILFHHASPAAFFAGQPTLLFGTFTPAPQSPGAPQPAFTLSTPLGSASFATVLQANTAAGAVVSANVVAITSGGVGFYVVSPASPLPLPTPTPVPTPTPTSPVTPTSAPTPEASVYPMDAKLGAGNPGSLPDPTNAFPVGASTTFSIYVIDALPNRTLPLQLVGVMD
jgi:hypothetical protein